MTVVSPINGYFLAFYTGIEQPKTRGIGSHDFFNTLINNYLQISTDSPFNLYKLFKKKCELILFTGRTIRTLQVKQIAV